MINYTLTLQTMFCASSIFNQPSKRLQLVFMIDDLRTMVDCITKFKLNVLFVI